MIHFFSPTATILSVTGKHAERYLQARLSNDVRACSTSRAILAAALTAQGKTEAFGFVFKDSSGTFHLLLDGEAVESLRTAIARFKVAEQVEINPSPFRVIHVIGQTGELILEQELGVPSPGDLPGATSVSGGTTGPIALIRRARTPTAGIDLVAPIPVFEKTLEALQRAGATEISPGDQVALRLEAKVPSFPEDINDSVILAEAGPLNAVSFTKGCYTGQEVIAKIDSLGKPPRILTRLSTPGEHRVPPGTGVLLNGKAVGKTTSSGFHRDHGVTYVFALLKNDGGKPTDLSIDGVSYTAS